MADAELRPVELPVTWDAAGAAATLTGRAALPKVIDAATPVVAIFPNY